MFDDYLEIEKAWKVLAMAEGNPLCECVSTGETWNYAGKNNLGFVFEHLHHPLTKRRQVIHIRDGKIVCND